MLMFNIGLPLWLSTFSLCFHIWGKHETETPLLRVYLE